MGDHRADAFKALKGQLKLDLNAPPASNKTMQPPTQSQLINQLLKSPELDRLSRELAQGFHSIATPTPTKLLNPPPWEVSNAQKQYAQGFLDALKHIQQLENFNYSDPPNVLSSPSGGLFTPILAQQPEIFAQSPILSPANPRDLQAVLQAMLPCTTSLPPASLAQTVASMANSLADTHNAALRIPSTTISQPSPVAIPQMLPASLSIPSSSTQSLANSIIRQVEEAAASSSLLSSELKKEAERLNKAEASSLPSIPEIKREAPTRAASEESDNSDDQSSTTSGNPGRLLPSKDGLNELSMDEQERRKLERKRLRNRMAASKCRQKKLERIADLEEQVNKEKMRSVQLDNDLDSLRRSLRSMQEKIAQHTQKGCQTPIMYKI